MCIHCIRPNIQSFGLFIKLAAENNNIERWISDELALSSAHLLMNNDMILIDLLIIIIYILWKWDVKSTSWFVKIIDGNTLANDGKVS